MGKIPMPPPPPAGAAVPGKTGPSWGFYAGCVLALLIASFAFGFWCSIAPKPCSLTGRFVAGGRGFVRVQVLGVGEECSQFGNITEMDNPEFILSTNDLQSTLFMPGDTVFATCKISVFMEELKITDCNFLSVVQRGR